MAESTQTPAATHADDPRMLEGLVQFQHPGKVLATMGLPSGTMTTGTTAAVLGLDPERYERAVRTMTARVREAACALSRDAAIVADVSALAIEPSDVIVAAGDSLVDDLQSWAEILRELIGQVTGSPATVINSGISGDTTTALLARFSDVLALQPRGLTIMIGLNDARRHGDDDAPMIVSDAETEANLRELRRRVERADQEIELSWITPPRVLPDLIGRDPWLRQREVTWRAEDVERKAQLVNALPDPVLDLHSLMTRAADVSAFLLHDGLHLSLDGQRLVTERLIKLWAARA
jgi:acyl-CoA thioesterase I